MNTVEPSHPAWLRFYIMPLLLLGALFSEINLTILGGEIPIRMSMGDCAIVCIILIYAWLFRNDLKQIVWGHTGLVAIGILFIGISILTGSIHNDLWLISIKFCIKFCALLLVLTVLFQCSLISRGTLTALCLIVIFINLVGIVEYFLCDEIKDFLLLFKSEESLNGRKYALASSVFPNPNPYGVFNAVFIVVMLGISIGYRSVVNRYLLGITIIFSMIGVILSSSRNALLTLVVGMILIAGVVFKDKKSFIKAFMVAIVMLTLMTSLALKFQKSFAFKIGNAVPAASKIYDGDQIELGDLLPNYDPKKRILIWEAGVKLFAEKPVFGVGANQFAYRNGITFGQKNPFFHMHNIFGEIVVNHGVIGLTLIIFLVIVWFKKTRSPWQVAIIVTLLTSHMLDCFITHNILWLIFVPWLVAVTTRDPAGLFYLANTSLDPA